MSNDISRQAKSSGFDIATAGIFSTPIRPFNRRRGLKNQDLARDFGRDFPPDTVLSGYEISKWLAGRDLNVHVEEGSNKSPNSWIKKINAASSTKHLGDYAYVIVNIQDGLWKVQTPAEAIVSDNACGRIASFADAQVRKIEHKYQAMDESTAPREALALAKIMHERASTIRDCAAREEVGNQKISALLIAAFKHEPGSVRDQSSLPAE